MRLTGLVTSSIERTLVKSLNFETILNQFSQMKARKVIC